MMKPNDIYQTEAMRAVRNVREEVGKEWAALSPEQIKKRQADVAGRLGLTLLPSNQEPQPKPLRRSA